jgi:hypothetical protein
LCREPTQSVFDEDPTVKPDPLITGIEPPNSALAGIGQITINGSNFSPRIEENAVFFGLNPATIVSASETQLLVQSPNIPDDSLEVKVSVLGALLFSNIMYYTLDSAVEEIGGFIDFDNAYGIAIDKDDNIFVSLVGNKIVKITPDNENETEDYATTTVDKASAMKFGPDGYLYYVNILRFMLRVPPGGGADEVFAVLPGNVFDLDFDPFGNIYAGGGGNAIYRVKNDASSTVAADYASIVIRTVRVYDGYLYVGGRDENTGQHLIWRNQIISADELGPKELHFDWNNEIGPGAQVLAITFAADGDMYVGTNTPDAIVTIHPDKTHEPLYPGVLEPDSYAFSWGNGEHLYVNRRNDISTASTKRVLKIFMQKEGAPYYGRQ